MEDQMRDFSRTITAIAEYDAFVEQPWPEHVNQAEAEALFAKEAQLGEDVGIAFGHDTADINSMDTCRGYVRPGYKNPVGGEANLSFVRKTVQGLLGGPPP